MTLITKQNSLLYVQVLNRLTCYIKRISVLPRVGRFDNKETIDNEVKPDILFNDIVRVIKLHVCRKNCCSW